MSMSIASMPVMFHPRLASISTNPTDFLIRMNSYASNIATISNNPSFKVTMFIGLKHDSLPPDLASRYENLLVIRVSDPTLNFRGFAKKCLHFLKDDEIDPSILIAGDTTVGLWSCVYARYISKKKVPIQVSIHGSFLGRVNGLIPFVKSKIRIRILKYLLPSVESVRVVSHGVKREMIGFFRVDPKKIFIAPIPFEDFPEVTTRDFHSFNFGVIGRLHPERNITEIIEVIEPFIPDRRLKRIHFIGSGSLAKKLKMWKVRMPESEKIVMEGERSHDEVLKLLPEIDILLSAAESEGYGLAIREAVISGAIVVARRNEGTTEILNSFHDGIFLYDTSREARAILNSLLSGEINPVPCVNGRGIQEAIDMQSIRNLCKSWTVI